MKIKKHLAIYLTFFLLLLNNWTYAFINKRSSHTLANTYYVKLSLSPFTSSFDHIETQHSNFHKELKNRGIDAKIGHTFKRYANGITIETDERHLKRIAEIEHVESIEPVRLYKRFKPKPVKIDKQKLIKRTNSGEILVAPNNDINSVHEITGVKKVHEKLGLTGKGVKVGIIDSGIDYRHPALGGCYGPGCRVAYGYNFLNETNDPFDDCDGHGTHVAAIIGGLDLETGFEGVAPNVIFGAYKMLSCENNSAADAYNEGNSDFRTDEITYMRAFEKAVDDGMEIINISAGGPGTARSPASLMMDELAKHKGIIFTASSGNNGDDDGILTNLNPAVTKNAISVGSFDTNKFLSFKAFDTSNPNFVLDYLNKDAVALPYKKAKAKVIKCNVNDYKESENKIPIIDTRDTTSLACLKLLKEPLKAIIILREIDPVIPGAIITSKQGDILIKYLEEHPNLELDFSDKYGYMKEHPYAVTPSSFSSWGLSEEFDIKPDICAPGGIIFSAYPINKSPYQLLSGTSMASPYMAGVAALYIEVFGKQESFEQLRTAFMNYAIPLKDRNKLLSSVLHQGSGFVNFYDTLKATSFVYPPKINLNDTVHFNKYHTLNIYNIGRKEMKYKLSHLPAPSVNGHNKTLVRNYYQLEYLTNNYANEHWFYSGWLKVTPLDKKMPVMSVPYAGLADDARRLPIFQTPEFPQLVNITTNKNKVATFTFNNTELKTSDESTISIVDLRLATPTNAIFTEVLNYNYKVLGVIKTFYNFPAQKLTSLKIEWDGLIYNPNDKNDKGIIAPNGEYFLRIKALKLFGDVNNENDYEVWISPKFRVKNST
ncbi:peptidase S8/S53 domain-containing protein [Glomus cerebriforme]|uniref:Peptidase S8/S53 domain-containing protein n=1 Tax=Glomus cerebriforme TaxID=658196 RepID=A0A397SFW1_9GLOM|nr:peptidase S8/S53 domain-containing protein [Glomus cerebriforme]